MTSYATDNERIALILVEALYNGDKEVARRWNISRQTVINYRNKLKEDENLLQVFTRKKKLYEREWAHELPAAIRSALQFIQRAGKEADPKNPDVIYAIAGALKIVAEIGLTKDVIDSRLGRLDWPNRGEGDEMDYTSLPANTIEG